MSTNKERLTKGITDFVNQECIIGDKYWMRRTEFEADLELFLDENEYDITWLMPIKCDRPNKSDLIPNRGDLRYPNKPLSLSGELIRLYPEIKRERRRNEPGLSGIASRAMRGVTLNDFIDGCIIFNPEKRVSNKEIGRSLFLFTDGMCRDEKLSMNVVNKAIIKKAIAGGHKIKQIMYNKNGKTVRGIQGVEVRYE